MREYKSKLDALAKVIGSLFNGEGPDILGLAEVANDVVLNELARLLPSKYQILSSNPVIPTQTGLGLLVREGVLHSIIPVAVQKPVDSARPRCIVIKCLIRSGGTPFFIAVNHWKSRLSSGRNAITDSADRKETAQWLGDLLAGYKSEICAIVMGDFNAEPCDSVFAETRTRSVRTFDKALGSKATPAYLYNTGWRFLTEPDFWEDSQKPGFKEERPKTTHDGAPNLVFDQLLVSGGALKGPPLKLIERSVCYFCEGTAKYTKKGALRPQRWEFANGCPSGVSDHFPLIALFELLEN